MASIKQKHIRGNRSPFMNKDYNDYNGYNDQNEIKKHIHKTTHLYEQTTISFIIF